MLYQLTHQPDHDSESISKPSQDNISKSSQTQRLWKSLSMLYSLHFFFLQLRVIIPSKPSDCCLGLSLLLFMENIYNSLYQIWVSLETKIQVEYLLFFFFCFFILGPNKMLFNVTDTWKIQKYLPAWTRVYKVGYGTGQYFNHSIY